MTRKERHIAFEGAAIIAASFFGLFTVPALINAHDTIPLVAAVGLIGVWLGWLLFFAYRLSREIK